MLGPNPGTLYHFQPYGGVGVGIFFASIGQNGQSVSDTAAGLDVLAGTRYFLFEHKALMVEYTYSRARSTFDNNPIFGLGFPTTWEADYSARLVTLGVGYHF